MPATGSDRPRRSRRSIRLRLAVIYGLLFLTCGAALLGITYGLFASGFNANYLVVAVDQGDSAQNAPASKVPAQQKAEQERELLEAQARQQRADAKRQLLIVSGIALGIMTLMSGGLGWVVAGRALRPVRAMITKAQRLSEHNLHERLAVTGPNDELKDLADTFDGLLARLDSAFEAQKRFVANASHELRTPLTYQRAAIEVALADPAADAESLRAVCGRVLASGEDQERLIEALLTLARSQRGLDHRVPVDLHAVAATVLRDRDAAPVRLDRTLSPASTAGDPRLMERLVTNLVDNAVRHNVSDGWATVWTGTHQGRPTLRVANTGPAVPPTLIDTLFQPFQRLESRTRHGDGFGLGLSIVAAISAAHDAHLTAESRHDGGLTVTVTFRPLPG